MTTIKLKLLGGRAEASVDGILTAGTVGLTARCSFDEAWDGLIPRLAVRCGGVERAAVIDGDGTAVIPWECLLGGEELYLSVDGWEESGALRLPSEWVNCGKVAFSAVDCAPEEPEPTPEMRQQIYSMAKKASDDVAELRQDYEQWQAAGGSQGGGVPESALEGYAKKEWVQEQGYLKEHQSLAGLARDADLAKVAKSGSYEDLTGKPAIPPAVTESTVAGWGFTKNEGTYSKPGGGIPESDLSEEVQTKLNSGHGAGGSDAIKTYDVFPSASALAQMPDGTVFRTKGFYEIGDGGDGEYIASKNYFANSFKVVSGAVTVHVKPLGDSKMLELSKCGLREGEEYGSANDAVIASLNLNFGMAIKFPQGHYYFGTGIDCTEKHLSIFGSGCTYTSDINTKGCTWLHFPNSDFGIKVNHCTLSNFNVVGNSAKNTVKVDRDQTYVNPAGIVTLTDTADTKGIYSVGNAQITNVSFRNWRYGLYCDTGNVYIDNVLARNCIVGVSTGNDAQLRGIYGWQIGTLWEARGGAVQASQLRADSVAQNLVHIVKGTGFYISGMNADYCYGSIVRIGSGNWQTIKNLTINGITGRWGCGACYDTTKDTAVTAQNLTADNLHLLPFISVDNNTSLVGADITLGGGGSNPLDTASNYLTPDAILCGGANSQVYGVSVRLSTSLEYAQNLDLDYLKNHFRSLSDYAQALKISVDSANSKVIFQQTGSAANPTFTVRTYGLDNSELASRVTAIEQELSGVSTLIGDGDIG